MSGEMEDRQFLRERVDEQIKELRRRLDVQKASLHNLVIYIEETEVDLECLEQCLADERADQPQD